MVNSKEVTEEKTCSFTTGEAPDYVPDNNITYSYPLKNMMNFYRNESSTGYIQLNRGQEYLFVNDPEWPQYGRLTPVSGGVPIYIHYDYFSAQKKVAHIIPAALNNNTVYKFDLIRVPVSAVAAIDKNVVKNMKVSTSNAGTMEITESKATTLLTIEKEKVLYSCYFRTSRYNTMAEKIRNVIIQFSNMDALNNSIVLLSGYTALNEVFDNYEFREDGNTGLIELVADVNGNWLSGYQIPLIYTNYPMTPNTTIQNRVTSDLGLVPVKATGFSFRDFKGRTLAEDEKITGIINISTGTVGYFHYNLSKYTYLDFYEMKTKLLNGSVRTPAITGFINAMYPGIMSRFDYPVIATYRLPDGTAGTSEIVNIKVLGRVL
jgi:hypothetical protein